MFISEDLISFTFNTFSFSWSLPAMILLITISFSSDFKLVAKSMISSANSSGVLSPHSEFVPVCNIINSGLKAIGGLE